MPRVQNTPATITVEIAKLGSEIITLELPEGSRVIDALQDAGLSYSENIRRSFQKVGLEDRLYDGDILTRAEEKVSQANDVDEPQEVAIAEEEATDAEFDAEEVETPVE